MVISQLGQSLSCKEVDKDRGFRTLTDATITFCMASIFLINTNSGPILTGPNDHGQLLKGSATQVIKKNAINFHHLMITCFRTQIFKREFSEIVNQPLVVLHLKSTDRLPRGWSWQKEKSRLYSTTSWRPGDWVFQWRGLHPGWLKRGLRGILRGCWLWECHHGLFRHQVMASWSLTILIYVNERDSKNDTNKKLGRFTITTHDNKFLFSGGEEDLIRAKKIKTAPSARPKLPQWKERKKE